jgi:two-component system sensor histidine kinase KdpD
MTGKRAAARAVSDHADVRAAAPGSRIRRAESRVPLQTVRPAAVLPDGFSYAALLSSLVHELRTPVTALATGSELLLDDLDELSRNDLRRIVQTMHRGAIWLQGLIENVLYAATLAEGEVRIYPRPIDPIELAHDIVPVVDSLMRQRGQELRIIDRLGGIRAMADSRRIGQVLINLIANASKYSGHGTRITVAASRRGGQVRLSVADRGPGLPGGDPARLFQPFTRAAEAGRAGIDGAGLGLAIVKSIAERHGGTAGAEARKGGGAVFWVQLPAAVDEGQPIARLVQEQQA